MLKMCSLSCASVTMMLLRNHVIHCGKCLSSCISPPILTRCQRKTAKDVMALATTELCKEFAFGAAAGLAAGYLSKKAGSAAVAAAGAVSFVCLRAAIFDGHHLATWSPLEACSFSFIRVSAHSRTVH